MSRRKPHAPPQARSRRGLFLLCGLLVLLAAGGAWWRLRSRHATAALGPEGGFENLLIVSFDTTRADHLGCYGSKTAATPVLDDLARHGVLFETCITPAPLTLPAHSSLLAGLEPFEHGARNNGTHRLARDVPTLAERLSKLGFATGAVVSTYVLDSRFGLDRGFASYDDDLSGGGLATAFTGETRGEDTIARAGKWLDARGKGRWFLWVHLFDPHADYNAPEPFGSRFRDAPYDGEIAYADSCLGTLLEKLEGRGELERTLVVMTADHGESLGEHREPTHGIFVYDATTHVPLILRHPALDAGLRVPAVVSLVDVVPTVLELLGVPPAAELGGRSLAGVALGRQPALDSVPAYSEDEVTYYNYGWAELRALRDENYRYVRAPKPELYDLRADPGETRNLFADAPEIAARYASLLQARLPKTEKNTRASESGELEPEVRGKLAALGYTFSGEAPVADADRPDPKDRIGDLLAQQKAESLMHAGRLAEAEDGYRAVLASNPRAIAVRDALSNVLNARGKVAEALEIQRGSLKLPGVSVMNFLIVAEFEKQLGIDGWQHSLELAKQFDDRAPMPWVREGDMVDVPAGKPEAALAAYRAALERDEHCAPAWLGISRVEAQRRNAKGALEAAVRATEIDPTLAEAWFLRGSMNAAGGNKQEAIVSLTRASELDPKDVKTRLGLVMLRATTGDESGALRDLHAALEVAPEEVRQAAAGNALLRQMLERVK